MSTDLIMSIPTDISTHSPKNDQVLVSRAENPKEPLEEYDDRSSSLSEIGDRPGNEDMDHAQHLKDFDENDTEAETERLEDTPRKMPLYQNVVMTTNDAEGPAQTSDISSLEDSGVEDRENPSSSPSSPRKRKRSSFDQNNLSDEGTLEESRTNPKRAARTPHIGPAILPDTVSVKYGQSALFSTLDLPATSSGAHDKNQQLALPKQKYKKGKRKGKKIADENVATAEDVQVRVDTTAGEDRNAEAMETNMEEAEMEDVDEGLETDNAAKNVEGLAKKKKAMDSLSALEKCFATLRDKLFDERLAACNEELAMLGRPMPIHPELLAMKEAVDQHRDRKIEYQDTFLRLKFESLHRESVANKSQCHSQYMQTVRDVRDKALEELNKEYYQMQKERRNCEGDVPDVMYKFTDKRSRQIKQQTAYNTEVSVLSGVAKYVGFPAAPEIGQARPKEIDDDLRRMRLVGSASHAVKNQPPALGANRSAATGFPRQRPAAEEDFLEQNAWANPQHPIHHQQRQQMHRQVSALSRAATPSSTPAGQGRIIDLTQPQGSASTIVEPQSGPRSSLAATPATGEQVTKASNPIRIPTLSERPLEATPSKLMGSPPEATPANAALIEASSDRPKVLALNSSEEDSSLLLARQSSREVQTQGALPKPLPFTQSGASARASPPVRYPMIKAEDAAHLSRSSPISHQFPGPTMVSIAPNGHLNRFAA